MSWVGRSELTFGQISPTHIHFLSSYISSGGATTAHLGEPVHVRAESDRGRDFQVVVAPDVSQSAAARHHEDLHCGRLRCDGIGHGRLTQRSSFSASIPAPIFLFFRFGDAKPMPPPASMPCWTWCATGSRWSWSPRLGS